MTTSATTSTQKQSVNTQIIQEFTERAKALRDETEQVIHTTREELSAFGSLLQWNDARYRGINQEIRIQALTDKVLQDIPDIRTQQDVLPIFNHLASARFTVAKEKWGATNMAEDVMFMLFAAQDFYAATQALTTALAEPKAAAARDYFTSLSDASKEAVYKIFRELVSSDPQLSGKALFTKSKSNSTKAQALFLASTQYKTEKAVLKVIKEIAKQPPKIETYPLKTLVPSSSSSYSSSSSSSSYFPDAFSSLSFDFSSPHYDDSKMKPATKPKDITTRTRASDTTTRSSRTDDALKQARLAASLSVSGDDEDDSINDPLSSFINIMVVEPKKTPSKDKQQSKVLQSEIDTQYLALAKKKEELTKINSTILQLTPTLTSLEKTLNSHKSTYNGYAMQLSAAEKRAQIAQTALKPFQDTIEGLKKDISKKETEIQTLQKEKDMSQAASAQAGRDEFATISVEQFDQIHTQLKTNITNLVTAKKESASYKESYTNNTKRLDDLTKISKQAEQTVTDITAKMSTLSTDIMQLDAKYQHLLKEKTKHSVQAESLKGNIQTLSTELQIKQKQLADANKESPEDIPLMQIDIHPSATDFSSGGSGGTTSVVEGHSPTPSVEESDEEDEDDEDALNASTPFFSTTTVSTNSETTLSSTSKPLVQLSVAQNQLLHASNMSSSALVDTPPISSSTVSSTPPLLPRVATPPKTITPTPTPVQPLLPAIADLLRNLPSAVVTTPASDRFEQAAVLDRGTRSVVTKRESSTPLSLSPPRQRRQSRKDDPGSRTQSLSSKPAMPTASRSSDTSPISESDRMSILITIMDETVQKKQSPDLARQSILDNVKGLQQDTQNKILKNIYEKSTAKDKTQTAAWIKAHITDDMNVLSAVICEVAQELSASK